MNNWDFTKHAGGFSNYDFNLFERIISLKNLFSAWNELRLGKENKLDVQKFAIDLEDNIFELHDDLRNNNYRHSSYKSFYLHDPKLRHIFKARVRDRILHHSIVKIIGPIFEKSFIFDSYSSRKNKGALRAIKRFRHFAQKLSRNNSRNIWVLKCDIKNFFDSVNHYKILDQISKKIYDKHTNSLLKNIIDSLNTSDKGGIPLGNLTSQLFSNIYLNDFDQFIKRQIRVKYYIRYNDDFIILGPNKKFLEDLIPQIKHFLEEKLKLDLHPQKIVIKTWRQGVDFLGYVSFPHFTILRTKTKRRIIRKIKRNLEKLKKDPAYENFFNQSHQSYLGILHHCRGYNIRKRIKVLTVQSGFSWSFGEQNIIESPIANI